MPISSWLSCLRSSAFRIQCRLVAPLIRCTSAKFEVVLRYELRFIIPVLSSSRTRAPPGKVMVTTSRDALAVTHIAYMPCDSSIAGRHYAASLGRISRSVKNMHRKRITKNSILHIAWYCASSQSPRFTSFPILTMRVLRFDGWGNENCLTHLIHPIQYPVTFNIEWIVSYVEKL